VFSQIYPNERFLLKRISCASVRQKLIAESLQRVAVTGLLVSHQKNDAEATLAKRAQNFVFASNDITSFENVFCVRHIALELCRAARQIDLVSS